MPTAKLPEDIRDYLRSAKISVELTEHILSATDNGRFNPPPIAVRNLPPVNGQSIIDFSGRNHALLTMELTKVQARLVDLGIDSQLAAALLHDCFPGATGQIEFSREDLHRLGLFFLPLVTFGILNGGSASSYYDHKKNQEFCPGLYQQLGGLIVAHAEQNANRPKGVGPAFLSAEKPLEPGYSFIELKLRGWLILLRQYQLAAARLPGRLPWDGLERILPVFQMVNRATAADIEQTMGSYRDSPLLRDLIAKTGIEITDFATGVQDLVAAFTQPDQTGSRQVFLKAFGQPGQPLGLPGGHGQNFKVLEPVYRQLAAAGKRFAYLGNVDNLGYLPDPGAIAMMILQNNPAGFEFSYKTGMDRKGGVLITTMEGRLTCGDIGQAVSSDLIATTEAAGTPLLFNCATGLFDLEWLIPNLENIQTNLPIRFTNQDKDAGLYSQAEQTTWEIIGMIDHPLIMAVEKQERFLASKFFLDCLLTSGLGTDTPELSLSDRQVLATGKHLNQGLIKLLQTRYGLELIDGNWSPVKI